MSSKFLQTHFPTYLRLHRSQSGIVFITVLFVGLLLTFVGLSFANVAILQLRRTSENVFVSNALLTAEAGIEQTLYQLNNSDSFTGYASEEEFFSGDEEGRGTYETSITPGSSANERVITSIGRTYRSGSDKVEKERRVRVTIVGTSSPGYSVQAGVGGLILRGSATITNSQVYVNGYIDMAGGGTRIGQDNAPLDIFVGNQNCPTGNSPGPTYPQVCTTGQPIRITDWWNTPVIGNVCATGQTQTRFPNAYGGDPQIRGGSGGAGLIAGCTAPPAPMPTYDRSAHIASMTTTTTGNNITYDCSQYMPWPSTDAFSRTWPANIRLNGNVNWGSSCDLVITGNAYITGNLLINGGARVRIADSVGTNRPVIVVDGDVHAGSGAVVIPNSSGTAAHFISFKSAPSSGCSPNCNPFTPMTGNALKDSQNLTTVRVDGGGGFPGSVFHSYWARVIIGGSGTVGSAIGQTIDLDGAGTITFGTALSSGESTWTIRSYQYDYE